MKIALVAKLVDAPDLGSGVVIRVGSSPIRRTERIREEILSFFFIGARRRKSVSLGLKSILAPETKKNGT